MSQDEQRNDLQALLQAVNDDSPVIVDSEDMTHDPYYSSLINRKLITKKVLKMFRNGRTDAEMRDYLVGLGYSKRTTENIIGKIRAEIRKEVEKYKKSIAEHSIAALQNIVVQSMEAGRFKEALAAIAELNKMGKVYDTNTNVTINNFGFDFDTGE